VINKQVTTIIIKLGKNDNLNSTVSTYNKICQEIINYGFENHTFNKNKLHYGTYKLIREKYPRFSSAMVQTARDHASDMLKSLKFKVKPIKKEYSSIRYDKRCLSVMFDKKKISINTMFGRLKLPLNVADYYLKYKDWKYTNAQLIRRKYKNYFLNLQMEQSPVEKQKEIKVLGIDVGIKNIATLSNNIFFNSKKLRNIKGKYQKQKSDLQSKGTKSSKRKLKLISGKENRFVKNVNHIISKQIVNLPYTLFAMENIKHIKTKRLNKTMRKNIGNWSFRKLMSFLEYKAERLGKSVIYINPRYTSQECSHCGFTDKNNRNNNLFHCNECGYELHADLNASRNIARIGISDFVQGAVNHPNVA